MKGAIRRLDRSPVVRRRQHRQAVEPGRWAVLAPARADLREHSPGRRSARRANGPRCCCGDCLQTDGARFAPKALLVRLTGDRVRDVDEAVRGRVRAELQRAASPASWVRLVDEAATMELGIRPRLAIRCRSA
ncbi:MAG: hypothetical protein U1G07_10755 [Verrucomicrobiota bacterium]